MSHSFPVLIEKYANAIITLEQARQWLRMDIDGYTGEDAIIETLIASAVDSVEKDTGLSLGLSTYEWNCKYRPQVISGSIQEIVSVKYWNGNVDTELPSTDYRLIRRGNMLTEIAWNPELQVSQNLEYTITFKAGFEAGKVPAGLLQAIRARISEQFDSRGDGVSEKRTLSDKLIFPYRNGYAG